MSLAYFATVLLLAPAALANPVERAAKPLPTIYLAGDSTMAKDGGGVPGVTNGAVDSIKK